MSGELVIGKDNIYGEGPHIALKIEVIDAGMAHVIETYYIKVPHSTPPNMFPVIARGHLFEDDWSRDDVEVRVTQLTKVQFVGMHHKIVNL